ncbi:GM12428 [Drosophila sechellia]|uniref:GM12428 n=1 Tax=Drosophila sechellia TaxID=7238 RepID=B4I0L1_DROSE|nr:GM12428 [Drosophila sechellia]
MDADMGMEMDMEMALHYVELDSGDRRHKADMHDTIIIIRQTRMATVCDATVKAGYKERSSN